MKTSHTRLIKAAQGGDREAFAELVRRHYPAVNALALATARDWSAAEDISQEVFVVAWTHLDRLRAPEAFLMWIRRITRNLSINWLRSEDFQTRLRQRYMEYRNPPSEASEARNNLDRDERRNELAEAIAELPGPIAEVMVMHYLQQRPGRQIAASLGITPNAVKKRLQRGRAAMRIYLEEKWREELKDASQRTDGDPVRGILASIALGPVAPEIAKSAAAFGPSLVAHHVAHGGAMSALKPALAGGLFLSGKQLGIAALVAIVCGLLLVWREMGLPEEIPGGAEQLALETTNRDSAVHDEETNGDSSAAGPAPAEEVSENNDIEEASVATDETVMPLLSAETEKEPSHMPDEPKHFIIEGIVVTEWDDPLPGILIEGLARFNSNYQSTLDAEKEIAERFADTTNAQGAFRIEGETAIKAMRLTLSDTSYQGGTTVGISDDIVLVRIEAKTGIPLHGRLLTPEGDGLAGALIVPKGFVTDNSAWGGDRNPAMSGSEGHFTLLFEQPGATLLRVVAPRYGEQLFSNVPVGLDEIVEITLKNTATLSGRITYPDGHGATDVFISARSQLNLSNASGSAGTTTTGSPLRVSTDVNGRYSFDAISPGVEYKIKVLTRNDTPLSAQELIGPFEPEEDARWDKVIENLVTITGTLVSTPSSLSIPGVGVAAMLDDEIPSSRLTHAVVETDGSFEIEVPRSLDTVTLVPHYKYVPAVNLLEIAGDVGKQIRLTSESEEVRLFLPDPFTIGLRAVDSGQMPVEGASIGLNWNPRPNSSYGWHTDWTTDSEGLFSWSGFAPFGTYKLSLRAEGYLSRDSLTYAGAPGEVFAEETIVLYRNSGVEGFLTLDGQPLGGANILLHAYTDSEQLARVKLNTASDGYFLTPDNIPATEVTLEIQVLQGDSAGASDPTWTSPLLDLRPNEVADLGTIDIGKTPSPEP